jgi:HlyD family secretion protein
VVAFALAIALGAVRARTVPAYVAERRPLVQRVVASGRVMPPARIELASLSLARVAEIMAREGDQVRAGQLLLRLEDTEARALLAQARARVQESAARLDQVRGVGSRTAGEALRQSQVRVARAERDLERARQLFDAGSGSAAQLDDAEKAVALAQSEAEAASAQAASLADAGPDQRLAAAALRQAQAAEAVARAKLDETRIRAPAPGRVLVRDVDAGDVVPAGKTLLVLAADGETLVTMHPDERNLAFLAPGQEADAAADAFPGRTFRARVTYVAPAVDPARGTVEVRLSVADPPPFLRPDMTVSVNVEVGRRAAALVVPSDAVHDAATDPWVLRVSGGRADRGAVKLGFRGDGLVEVLEGLSPGDAVVPASAGTVGEGTRVRIRRLPLPAELARAL